MTEPSINKSEIISGICDAVAQLTAIMNSIEDDKVNSVSYDGSWTAPQLLRHVTKTISVMGNALQMNAKPTHIDPGEKTGELRKVFLDFSSKLKSPEFIIPEGGDYEKKIVLMTWIYLTINLRHM